MHQIIDIEYSEFFSVGDKITLGSKAGIVLQTYDIDEENIIIGGSLIVCWDSSTEYDIEIIKNDVENFLIKIDDSYEFVYIDDFGNPK